MDKQNKPKGFVNRLAAFVMGWGFYIVLFLCIAVVGVSAWTLIAAGKRAMGDVENDLSAVVTSPGSSYTAEDFYTPAPLPEETPLPPETSSPEEAPSQPAANLETPAAEPAAAESPAPEPLFFIWPLNGSVDQPFALETLVYSKTMDDWRSHGGLDIAAELGTKVSAIARGTVAHVYADPLYGTTVVLDHGDGLQSIYCNLAATPTVQEGDNVAVGDVIGAVGDTALIEVGQAYHLHLELQQDGSPVDPLLYLPQR